FVRNRALERGAPAHQLVGQCRASTVDPDRSYSRPSFGEAGTRHDPQTSARVVYSGHLWRLLGQPVRVQVRHRAFPICILRLP
ncbi:hypothetical protein HDU93_006070, partial [Gonapodya sp. JEL0774]